MQDQKCNAVQIGGEGGIRTHGEREPTAVFKTAALNHSATSPLTRLSGHKPRISSPFSQLCLIGGRITLPTSCAPSAMNIAGASRPKASSLGGVEEGVLQMSGWLIVGLSAAALNPVPAAAPQLTQVDVTTQTYTAPPADPW